MTILHNKHQVNRKNKKNTSFLKNSRNNTQQCIYFLARANILQKIHKYYYPHYMSRNMEAVLAHLIRECSSPNKKFMPDGKLWYFDTQKKIAKLLGISPRTIFSILKKLEKLGLIISKQLMKKTRGILTKSYSICVSFIQKLLGLSSKDIFNSINNKSRTVDNSRSVGGDIATLASSDHLRITTLKNYNKNRLNKEENKQKGIGHIARFLKPWLERLRT